MSDIKLFKLMSGEEILGVVVDRGTNRPTIALQDVVTITYHPMENGQMGAGFAPHMPMSVGDVELSLHAIAMEAHANDNMIDEYKRIFNKIITPPTDIIL